MAGTKAGGEAAAKTNKKKYGVDFYAKIGQRGGVKTGIKGFAAGTRDTARSAGSKGGKLSVRGLHFEYEEKGIRYYRHVASNELRTFKVNMSGQLLPVKTIPVKAVDNS